MLIRHKILVWFSSLTGILLFLFSVYIYFAYTTSREAAFRERIKNKALATKDIYDLHNQLAEKIITSIPEQSEYVYDDNYHRVFAINDRSDFNFDKAFFDKLKLAENKELYFEYPPRESLERKEGYAFMFGNNGQEKTVIITAYDKVGREQTRKLGNILFFGNIFFLSLIALSGYLFARSILKPIDELVAQTEAVNPGGLQFRLHYQNPRDEIGIVTTSFNKVLERIQDLAEVQKSFIAHASHELRTPLAAVSGILETAVKYDNNVDAIRCSIEAGNKELQRAIGITNGLLQLAKIEAAQDIEISKINCIDLLIDVISFYKLKKNNQEFLLQIDERLSADVSIEISGNKYLLHTAFLNIIDNASKYSFGKKINIYVTLLSVRVLSIKVIDQGIGIEPDDMNNILSPLYRGRNTSGIEGFGLGLPLTRRIITLHKGDIIFTNNANIGTTVTINLATSVTQLV